MMLRGMEISRGLLVREPWISLILSGEKIWEMRSRRTRIKGNIALIRQGSGHICATANLLGSLEKIEKDQFEKKWFYHRIPHDQTSRCVERGWLFPWVLSDVVMSYVLIPYNHKRGAVTWVDLT